MEENQQTDAIRHAVVVPHPPEPAFARFTERIGEWWPTENTFARAQGHPESLETVVIEPYSGGRWYERAVDGSESSWGEVRQWDPPYRLVLGWQITHKGQPEPDPAKASNVEVTFVTEGESATRVVIRHDAFDHHGPEGASIWRHAMDFSEGWPRFLARFQQFASQP